MDTSTDLFFLRSDLPDHPISQGYRWSLFVVKIRGTASKAYVGFRSAADARLIADQSPLLSVVALADLDAQHSHDFTHTAIMLLESPGEVIEFIKDRRAYPVEEHLYRYSAGEGLKKVT